MAPATVAADDENLVTRRPRRSTAGNRMAAALAEISLEELIKDVEDDIDFVNEKDEEDMFESDFASTDEEMGAEGEEQTAEKEVEAEERIARKQARSKLERVTQAAHEKHKATFNPLATPTDAAKPKAKPKPRVLVGASGTEAGEPAEAVDGPVGSKRKSQRTHTVLNTSASVQRIQESGKKAAVMPKKAKAEIKTLTQAELIARALDNEEGNIAQHRDYLQLEEEKRKRARVVRTTIEGPVLRWVSKAEIATVVEQPPPPPPPPPKVTPQVQAPAVPTSFAQTNARGTPSFPRSAYPYTYGAYSTVTGSMPYGQSTYPYNPYARPYTYTSSYYALSTPGASSSTASNIPNQSASSISAASSALTSTNPAATSTPEPNPATVSPATASSKTATTPIVPLNALLAQAAATLPVVAPQPSVRSVPSTTTGVAQSLAMMNSTEVATAQILVPSPAVASTPSSQGVAPAVVTLQPPASATTATPPPIVRKEKVEKNYVMHELSQNSGASKPAWGQTMRAMFGEDINWEELKVYVGKGRPLSRPQLTCPITGKPAKYRDPRSGVPYADVRAFQVLTQVLKHEFIWSKELGCYIGRRETSSSASDKSGGVDAMDTS